MIYDLYGVLAPKYDEGWQTYLSTSLLQSLSVFLLRECRTLLKDDPKREDHDVLDQHRVVLGDLLIRKAMPAKFHPQT